MRQARKSSAFLIPPYETVLHVLDIQREVAIELISIVWCRRRDVQGVVEKIVGFRCYRLLL